MNELNVVSAQYYNNLDGQVTGIKVHTNTEVLEIPLDPANRHYAEIMRQVEAGELTIQEADNS